MVYIGKINGPTLLSVLERLRRRFRKGYLYKYVFMQGALVEKRLGERFLLQGYDSIIKKLKNHEFKDIVKPIIHINDMRCIKVAFIDSEYRIVELMIQYDPIKEERSLLGDNYRIIRRKEIPHKYHQSILNGAYK